MIERSESSRYAKHVFFSKFNDVDIFIEDTAIESKKIYVELLTRALGGGIKISQVFPIGSKSKVISKCREDQGERARKAVYIVDGDFDVLCSVDHPGFKRLYRLDRYSIENYLLDENALLKILDEEVLDRDERQIGALLEYHSWMSKLATSIRRLTVAAAVGKRRSCGVPVVNFPISEICSTECGSVDDAKIEARIDRIRRGVEARCEMGEFDRDCCDIENNFPANDPLSWVLRHTPGKTILFPLLRRRLRHLFNFSHNDASFRLRLAKKADARSLSGISECVE
ncbi:MULTISPECIES: DUF4435 domain-containing protein [unclassified Stenotrophomonas]|uniref:DUF4435 domain-containing protein n=1 Tax=unclassified Stenotrophomonas TaxID=196198 RepID=UPI003F9D1B74